MRLSSAQTEVILSCVRRQYGADATVMLELKQRQKNLLEKSWRMPANPATARSP